MISYFFGNTQIPGEIRFIAVLRKIIDIAGSKYQIVIFGTMLFNNCPLQEEDPGCLLLRDRDLGGDSPDHRCDGLDDSEFDRREYLRGGCDRYYPDGWDPACRAAPHRLWPGYRRVSEETPDDAQAADHEQDRFLAERRTARHLPPALRPCHDRRYRLSVFTVLMIALMFVK